MVQTPDNQGWIISKRWRRLVMEDDEAIEYAAKERAKNNRVLQAINNAAEPLAVFFSEDREALKKRVRELEIECDLAWKKRRTADMQVRNLQVELNLANQRIHQLGHENENCRETIQQFDDITNHLQSYARHLEDSLCDTLQEKKIEREAFCLRAYGEYGRTFTLNTAAGFATSEDCLEWNIIPDPETSSEDSELGEIIWDED
jgi:hypothetical protein